MRHLHTRHRLFSRAKRLTIIWFFVSIGMAMMESVWSLYFESFGLTPSTIGFITAGLVILSFLTSFTITPILERYSLIKLLLSSLIISCIAFFIIGIVGGLITLIVVAGILTSTSVVRLNSFNIIFRDSIKKGMLNQEEGFSFALRNTGWMIGPLIGGFFLLYLTVQSVFIAVSFFLLIAIILLGMQQLTTLQKKRLRIDTNPYTIIKQFFKKKSLILAYSMAGGIAFWWALIYIYVPLFIIKNGLSKGTVGIFLAIIAIPLILLEYPAGTLSKKFGLKPFFVIGFLGLTLSGMLAFFSTTITTQLLFIGVGSIFAALLEPLQDTFFFKLVTKTEEEKYYPLHNTATDIGSFIGKFSIAVVLLILPSTYAYLTASIGCAILAVLATRIPKTIH